MLGDNVILVIAGNKTDLNKDRHVEVTTAIQYYIFVFNFELQYLISFLEIQKALDFMDFIFMFR